MLSDRRILVNCAPTLSYRYLAKGPCVLQWSLGSKFLFVTVGHSPADPKGSTGSSGRTLVLPMPRTLGEAAIPAGGFDPAADQFPKGIQVIRQWLVAPRFDANSYAYTSIEFQGNLFRIPLHSR